MPRPTDLPTDGTCEAGHSCLGLLSPGTYHTKVFSPGFAFTMPTAGWENLSQEGGIFGLQSISNGSLGDAILFFRQPRPTTPDGNLVAGVDIKVSAIEGWLAANKAFTTTPATKVIIGGLSGERTDLAIAPGVQSHQSDCPVQTCVWMFRGKAATWVWDWSFAGPERQRLYLLTATDGVIAIFVDSLDGATFDALTKVADQILATVKFDRM